MIRLTHLRPSDYHEQEWKNGLGTTTEILKDEATPMGWRLSSAKVEGEQAFSLYPGYDRTLVLLDGGPMRLRVGNAKERKLQVGNPFAFSGDLETVGKMESPGRDFNLFCLRGSTKGNIYTSYIQREEELQYPIVGKEHFLYALEGNVRIEERNTAQVMTLGSQELFRLHRSDQKEYVNIKVVGVSARALLLWIPLHQVS